MVSLMGGFELMGDEISGKSKQQLSPGRSFPAKPSVDNHKLLEVAKDQGCGQLPETESERRLPGSVLNRPLLDYSLSGVIHTPSPSCTQPHPAANQQVLEVGRYSTSAGLNGQGRASPNSQVPASGLALRRARCLEK